MGGGGAIGSEVRDRQNAGEAEMKSWGKDGRARIRVHLVYSIRRASCCITMLLSGITLFSCARRHMRLKYK